MSFAIDLTGKQYGELTVIEMLYNYNNKKRTYCRCVDFNGEETIVRQDALQSGATKTICGSKNKGKCKDLTGMIFGRLTAVEPLDDRGKNRSIIWKCLCECGNFKNVSAGDLVRGRTISCGCDIQEYYDSLALDLSNMKFGMVTAIELFGRVGKPGHFKRVWRCRCDCGNEIFVSVADLQSGNTRSCGCNKLSHGEQYVTQVLQDNSIEFVSQYRFDDCKNIRILPFDFYLPEHNTCIEYDGIQHFQSVDFFDGEDGLLKRKHNDYIKDKYCLNRNIKLIRIPYTYTKDEIEDCILNILSPVTITA